MAGMQLPEYLQGKTPDELKVMADQAKAKIAASESKKEEPPKEKK